MNPFSQEQAKWIMVEYAKVKSPTIVRREFRKFFKVTPRKVPHVQEFQRISDRFQNTGNVTPQKPSGPPKIPAENISAVENRSRQVHIVMYFRISSHNY